MDRRLENLRRIRQERLKAQEEACERQIRELEQQLRERFGAATRGRFGPDLITPP